MNEALRILNILLPNTISHTREAITQKVDSVLGMAEYNHLDRDQFIREVETHYNIRADNWTALEGKESRLPWLTNRRADIRWNFWDRYYSFQEDYKGLAPQTLRRLDRLTDYILDKLFDPTLQGVQIDKRGLVVGQVQSGKTANYTGLICKAVDAGYKLVIVLAGIHNNLRAQTQLRLDEGFLGFDTQSARNYYNASTSFGVSQIKRGIVAHSITSSHDGGDFTTGAFTSLGLNFDTNEPIILIVKKHPKVLGRLITWLKSRGENDEEGNRYIASKSVLLIDDEADHASLSTNKDPDKPTRINGQIREILRLFHKSAYVGYTATPFANIFVPVERDQLFPRDFIINIPAPSNYVGPEQVFGFSALSNDTGLDTTLPIVHRINDIGAFMPEKEREAPLPDAIPDSLKRAIRCFLLVCAIRRVRGQHKAHNSMLIHVTRYTARQKSLTELIDDTFAYYKRGIDQNDPTILELMRQTFEEDTDDYPSFTTTTQRILDSPLRSLDPAMRVHAWDEVLPHLYPAVARIRVREINGKSGDALDYFDEKEGLSVIAVGGDKLSRGLTLEGLSISYFLRPAKMYDTLMQMGRWFGYRPGYPDLCRLFTTRELNEWFCHITKASEHLREEFEYMMSQGRAPDEYALKVQTHDGVLQITAANKMRRAVEMRLSFAGRLVETYLFDLHPKIISENLAQMQTFVAGLGEVHHRERAHYVWQGVSAQAVTDFLANYRTAKSLYRADAQTIAKFIEAQVKNGELTDWTVVLISRQKPKQEVSYLIDGKSVAIGITERTAQESSSGDGYYHLIKSHLISPEHEFIDLDPTQRGEAIKLTALKRTADQIQGEHLKNPIPELAGLDNDAQKATLMQLAEARIAAGQGVIPDYPNGELVRNNIRSKQKPLLLLYNLDPEKAKLPADGPPIAGFAISFPASAFDEAISFAVHEQLVSFLNQQDTVDNDEDADED